MFGQNLTLGIDHAHHSVLWDFKGFVVGAVLFRFLCHQPDIGNRAHGLGIEGAVFLAKFDNRLIDCGIGAIGDNREGILGPTLSIPHFAPLSDHCWHGGINDDVTWYVEIGDALVGVDHGERGASREGCFEVGFQQGLFCGGKLLQLGLHPSEAVTEINPKFGQCFLMLGGEVT